MYTHSCEAACGKGAAEGQPVVASIARCFGFGGTGSTEVAPAFVLTGPSFQEGVLKKAAEKAVEEQERREARALPAERIQINSERLEKAKELREKQVRTEHAVAGANCSPLALLPRMCAATSSTMAVPNQCTTVGCNAF
jgi:hypothetical protein